MEIAITIGSIFLGLFFLFGLGYAICKLFDWLHERSLKTNAEDAEQYLHQLTHPQPGELQAHYGHPLPAVLLSLYRDTAEIRRTDFEVAESESDHQNENAWFIAFYNPLDIGSLKHTCFDSDQYFGFADDGCGNSYIVDPRLDDPAVIFHDHEDEGMTPVCDKLSNFINWPRFEVEE